MTAQPIAPCAKCGKAPAFKYKCGPKYCWTWLSCENGHGKMRYFAYEPKAIAAWNAAQRTGAGK